MKTIEKKSGFGGSRYAVYEIGEYPPSSVLAGQDRKQFLASYDDMESAKQAHPDAEEGYHDCNNSFTHLPGEDTMDGQGAQ